MLTKLRKNEEKFIKQLIFKNQLLSKFKTTISLQVKN